jgi:hypothetical protein
MAVIMAVEQNRGEQEPTAGQARQVDGSFRGAGRRNVGMSLREIGAGEGCRPESASGDGFLGDGWGAGGRPGLRYPYI